MTFNRNEDRETGLLTWTHFRPKLVLKIERKKRTFDVHGIELILHLFNFFNIFYPIFGLRIVIETQVIIASFAV